MESAELGQSENTIAAASDVRNAILQAEREVFTTKWNLENAQLDFYMNFINLLTTIDFFNPILTSVSKEIFGRFNPRSKISVHATFLSPGEFCDSPGYFQVHFLSSGFPNITPSWENDFCKKAHCNVSPYVQKRVRSFMENKGWRVWWTPDFFCFQDANEYHLVQDAMTLGSFFKDIQPLSLHSHRAESSRLSRLDLNN
jgi:hypothetical protein